MAFGALAQLGEHLLCKQGVVGSIPSSSTTYPSQSLVVFLVVHAIGVTLLIGCNVGHLVSLSANNKAASRKTICL